MVWPSSLQITALLKPLFSLKQSSQGCVWLSNHSGTGAAKDLEHLQVYKQYHPYQYLAYWYEMRRTYEDLFGCLTEMDPQDYARATGGLLPLLRTCCSCSAHAASEMCAQLPCVLFSLCSQRRTQHCVPSFICCERIEPAKKIVSCLQDSQL